MSKEIRTKGDILINEIKVGDIYYEYEYGLGMELEVLTKPERDDDGFWSWKVKNTKTGQELEHGQNEDYPHYGLNIYKDKAYIVNKYI